MEEFQNIIVQMLKTNRDQQQKLEERQQSHEQKLKERQRRLFMQLHKQQIEFQQFTLQKIELQ